MSAAAPASAAETWLETIESESRLLLIAPHGGRAGEAARSVLHPKVNDLHTADITRDLAGRLKASALINSGMDRNRLDCNRISQLMEQAPWLLEMVAERVSAIVARHGHATVLLIHGWNIIEPRVDLGLGLRRFGNELRPPGAAQVSASDDFIHGPLADYAERLRGAGIQPSFGMRYPGGGMQNLLQAFTRRHLESKCEALRRISAMAAQGLIDAVQLELSVAVRMPGPLREECIAAATGAFPQTGTMAPKASEIAVVRVPRISQQSRVPVPGPSRVGIEFYDPSAKIGAMASFDLGAPGFGARIMMLSGERRVALCTCEGSTRRGRDGLSLGPLALSIAPRTLALEFRGPAVVVPDSTAYLSIERALADGWLDHQMQISLRMPNLPASFDPSVLLGTADSGLGSQSSFGTLSGEIKIDGTSRLIEARARVGVSFTGLGQQNFLTRRRLWVSFSDDSFPEALEFFTSSDDSGSAHKSARVFAEGRWSEATLANLDIIAPSFDSPPDAITAGYINEHSELVELSGLVSAFVPLSRPGPEMSRIYTSLGFADLKLGDRIGSGMFEYSQRVSSMGAESDLTEVDLE